MCRCHLDQESLVFAVKSWKGRVYLFFREGSKNMNIIKCKRYNIILIMTFVVLSFFLMVPVKAESLNNPIPNPFLSSELYSITHFDSSQSDSTLYRPPRGTYHVELAGKPVSYGGPVNIITLASTDPDFMWVVGSDRVAYVDKKNGKWTEVASFQALEDASGGSLPAVPGESFKEFGKSTAVGMDVEEMDLYLADLFGTDYADRFGHGSYSVVDNENVLYTHYDANLYGFALTDPDDPSAGITVRYEIENVIEEIQGDDYPVGTRLFGISMTYDGHLIVAFSNGIAVIDRDLDLASKHFYRFDDEDYVSNSVAVDDKGGIYIASATTVAPIEGTMRKLVWTGTEISDDPDDGAWEFEYEASSELPPIIKFGYGSGSTPTLMGFGDDEDKLVVITDGRKQMRLLAFWRDEIPVGGQRVAGEIPVTCGFDELPDWIQTEQSVVVSGYGAFVVNNMPETVDPYLPGKNKILQVALMGPAYTTSYGAERFEWDPTTDKWSSVWTRSDVSSTSMVPVHSQAGKMAMVNGYTDENGWEITGMDWDTGETVHRTIFGDANFGNGAYAILQYLKNGDLLFNSFCGPIRVSYDTGGSGGCAVGSLSFAILFLIPLVNLKRRP